MGKKLKVLIPLAVIAVAGFFGFIQVRWYLYTMKVHEEMDKSGRFPTIPQIVAVHDILKDLAEKSHIPLETWREETKIQGRNEGPLRFYYIVVKVWDDKREYEYGGHRIESEAQILTEPGIAELAEHKIDVEK